MLNTCQEKKNWQFRYLPAAVFVDSIKKIVFSPKNQMRVKNRQNHT